jgi:L,D-transpeptidase catalytic domain
MVNPVTTARSTVAMRRWGSPAIVMLAVMAALTAPTADATARQARPKPPTEAAAPRDAGEPIMAIVSIKTQQITIYDADGWILRAPVSTGTTGRETPAGVFAILEKTRHLERHRAARRAAARICGLARLRADALWLCGEAVRQDADRDAGNRLA